MTQATPKFDPARFKQTTHAQWQEAAEAWHRWGPLLERWLGAATQTMFDMGGMTEGSRVLDVAAGAGEQTVAAARRVGPAGHVLATDLSSNILGFALESAKQAGFDNVEIRELDGERVAELPADSFDVVISRVGLIYFPNQLAAVRGMHSVLKPGGRLSVMSYSTADKNGFFSLPVSIIRDRAKLPPPQPGQPGPFSLGDPAVLEKLLVDAGFRDVEVRTVEAPVRVESAAECVRFERESFGALHQMLSSLGEAERDEVWRDIEEALQQFEGSGGFVGPCELVLGAGTK
ncbi:MAG: methyltransferase domain-containing protein [Planctomycetes bacterium]|nr:methyltransferase domain-containing protein [Planctomycetota bacterium]